MAQGNIVAIVNEYRNFLIDNPNRKCITCSGCGRRAARKAPVWQYSREDSVAIGRCRRRMFIVILSILPAIVDDQSIL